jgi:hypothetical protein
MNILFLFISLAAFSFASWSLDIFSNSHSTSESTSYYLAMQLILMASYLWWFFRIDKKLVINWKVAAFMVFVATVFTPSVLETDQIRYVWDGLQSAQGENPYRQAPARVEGFDNLEADWAAQINHADMNTIYPPAAQLAFQTSSYLNPFFWRDYFAIEMGPRLDRSNMWQIELGWKIFVGVTLVLLIWTLRSKRWDFLVLHPLFLTKVIGNGSLDALLLVGVGLFFYGPMFSDKKRSQLIVYCIAVLTKWLPLVLLPLNILHWSRRLPRSKVVFNLLIIMGIVLCSIWGYSIGAEGNFFNSLGAYANHWTFFGFVHGAINVCLEYVLNIQDSIRIAKIICFFLGAGWCFIVLKKFYLQEISLRLASLLVIIGALALSPTIHPWYLLVLLPLNLPYQRVLYTGWVWPMLGLLSHSHYINNSTPVLLQVLVYSLVSFVMILDFRKIFTL